MNCRIGKNQKEGVTNAIGGFDKVINHLLYFRSSYESPRSDF